MNKKILLTIPIIAAAIIGSLFLYSQNNKETSASVSRSGLTLDLDFGNNNGAANPTVYDSSGFARHATSTAGASAPICNNSMCDFIPNDFMTVDSTNVFNSSNISIAIKFTPDFAAGDSSQYFWVDSVSSLGVSIIKTAGNQLQVYLGGSSTIGSTLAEFSPYWRTGQENVLVIVATSGNNKAYLNGYLIDSIGGAWSPADYTSLNIGKRASNIQYFDGKLHYLKVWNRLLTDQEVQILSADRETIANTAVRSGATGSSTGTLVGYWTMDVNDMSANGATMYDKSGRGNNATMIGTTTSTGKIAQARDFDGSSDYMQIANDQSLDFTSNFTLSAWVNPDQIRSYMPILIRGEGDVDDIEWYVTTSGGFLVMNRGNGGTQSSSGALTNPTVGKWNHLAINFDGTNYRYYLDGVLKSGPSAILSPLDSDKLWRIGWIEHVAFGVNDKWDGSIDDVRIYNYALSAQEIANLYSSAKTKYTASAPLLGLVGYWSLDANDINGTTVYDKSGKGNNGTTIASPTGVSGKVKQALDFDGSTQYITTIGDDIFDFGIGNFTASAWIKLDDVAGAEAVMGKYNANIAGQRGWIIRVDSGVFSGFIDLPGANIIGATTMSAGAWHHITMVRNGNNGYVYLNGTQDGTASGLSALNATSNIVLEIGAQGKGVGPFGGSIDEVRIYNRALSAAEVANLYESAKRTYIQ